MKPGAYVGIDSGGTRTNIEVLVIDNSEDRCSASDEVRESLSGSLSPELIPSVLRRIFAVLDMRLERLQLDALPCFAWVSAAGFSPWTRDSYVEALEELVPTVAHGRFRSVGVANDAVSLLLGSGADGIVIAGTGSNTLVQSTDGSLYQAGGRDWVASDYGSGFWIGLRAIRQAYRDFEAGYESVLLQRLRDVYGVRAGDDRGLIAKLRDLSIGDENMKKEIARVTASVCAAAERGDLGAQNIVKAEAEDLADILAGSLRRCFIREKLVSGLTIVQCGSVLGNGFYRSTFQSQVEMRLLSGSEQKARLEWKQAATGRESAVQLAADLEDRTDALLRLSLDFRPAIFRPATSIQPRL
jgi:N-acetylglucosamine kinase-like BadF-type ATPase